jgi:hypothetical protein
MMAGFALYMTSIVMSPMSNHNMFAIQGGHKSGRAKGLPAAVGRCPDEGSTSYRDSDADDALPDSVERRLSHSSSGVERTIDSALVREAYPVVQTNLGPVVSMPAPGLSGDPGCQSSSLHGPRQQP